MACKLQAVPASGSTRKSFIFSAERDLIAVSGKVFGAFAFLFMVFSASLCGAQSWKTWPAEPGYKKLDYPLVFVASYRDGSKSNGGNLGTDVIEAVGPEPGNELWILLPNGNTKRLFPWPDVHQSIVDYPIGPENGQKNGAVTEPSISIDGKRVYFSYFHDTVNCPGGYACPGHSNFQGWPLGADIYAVDLTNILADYNFDPKLLPVFRLTQTTDKYETAMNPALAQNTGGSFDRAPGNVYLSPVEMDTYKGRKLVFASDLKRLRNSNIPQGATNRNLNLFEADLNLSSTVSISNLRQLQYYTTTSALSPVRIRNGIAFSYQGTTEQPRNWDIHFMNSEGKWGPLFGYGRATDLAHLGTFCVKKSSGANPPGDYFFTTLYYNLNNNGFGPVYGQNLAQAGVNTYDNSSSSGAGYVPRQSGSYLFTLGVKHGDYPSNKGKFSTPACGGPDEIFLAYCKTNCNHKYPNTELYDSAIVFSNLEPFDPVDNPGDYQYVLESTTSQWGAIWPKPVIDWSYRTTGVPDPDGAAGQDYSPAIADPETPVSPGMPYAVVGTSALYNTDVTPPDCRLSGGYYDPQNTSNNAYDQIINNIEGLSWVQDPSPGFIGDPIPGGVCAKPKPEHIFGIAVYETSNKPSNTSDKGTSSGSGYNTNGSDGKVRETKRLLGVYPVTAQPDTSFKAIIPANIPVDWHLLHSSYGLKLADFRGWHSFKPRELRSDCGGCHNHKAGEGIDWDSAFAASPSVPALDMTAQTTKIDYNESCTPVASTVNAPTTDIPVWQDISQGFDQHCGSCHRNDSSDQAAKNAFSYDPSLLNSSASGNPVSTLVERKFINVHYGALSSPAFWAARGQRTDGRDNNKPQYQPDYANGIWGFHFSPVHATIGARGQGLCDGDPANGPTASWVYSFGLWIDNHLPRDSVSGNPYPYHFDRYHPTVDSALTDPACSPGQLRVGFWDDSGAIQTLEVNVNGSSFYKLDDPTNGIPNGSTVIDISTLGSADNIEIKAVDAAGNRQTYSKTLDMLLMECTGAPPPTPSPTPTPTPTPTPIPPDSPGSPLLTVNPAEAFPGDIITFSISHPSVSASSDVRVACTVNSGSLSVNPAAVSIVDAADKFAAVTAEELTSVLSDSKASIKARVVKNFNVKKHPTLLCTGYIKLLDGSYSQTNTASLSLTLPSGKKQSKKLKKAAKKTTKRFKRKRAKKKALIRSLKKKKSACNKKKCRKKYKNKIQKVKTALLKLTLKARGLYLIPLATSFGL